MANVMDELSLDSTKYMIIIHGLLCVYHSINIASKFLAEEIVMLLFNKSKQTKIMPRIVLKINML